MALFTVPVRLASKAALVAADVAAAFAAIVNTINGNLSSANYASGTWILNAHKDQPQTVGVAQIATAPLAVGTAGTRTYNARMHQLAPGTMLEWCLTFAPAVAGTASGATFRLKRNGVQVGTDYVHAPATAFVDRREVVASAPVAGDSLWTLEVVDSGSGKVPAVCCSIAVKAPHVR